MSAPLHTPGPWIILTDAQHTDVRDIDPMGEPINEVVTRYVVAVDEHGEHTLVADVWADYPEIDLALPLNPNANARLITTAPAMFDMLKVALRALLTAPRFSVPSLATNSYAISAQIEQLFASIERDAA